MSKRALLCSALIAGASGCSTQELPTAAVDGALRNGCASASIETDRQVDGAREARAQGGGGPDRPQAGVYGLSLW